MWIAQILTLPHKYKSMVCVDYTNLNAATWILENFMLPNMNRLRICVDNKKLSVVCRR